MKRWAHGLACGMFSFQYGLVIGNRLVILVHRDHGIIDCFSNVSKDVESYLGWYVEKLTILADAQVREAIDGFVYQFFDFIVLFGG